MVEDRRRCDTIATASRVLIWVCTLHCGIPRSATFSGPAQHATNHHYGIYGPGSKHEVMRLVEFLRPSALAVLKELLTGNRDMLMALVQRFKREATYADLEFAYTEQEASDFLANLLAAADRRP